MPQATKSKDGCINQLKIAENHLSGNYQEKRESYDKEEQLMIYLSKGHSPNDKYESYDEILMPIGALLNNTLNYQEKNEVIKEYGLDDEEFEERMRDMCNLGEVIELEALDKGDNAKHCPRFLIKEFLIFSRRNFKEDNKNKTYYNNN